MNREIDEPNDKPGPTICATCTRHPGCALMPVRKKDDKGQLYWECSEFIPKAANTGEIRGSGTKLDDGKPSISLLHRSFVEGTAQVMTFGKTRYGLHNWCKGIAYSRLIDAAMRHLIAFNSGEDIDKDSGLPHIHCAAANLNMLSGMIELHPELDDRYRP